ESVQIAAIVQRDRTAKDGRVEIDDNRAASCVRVVAGDRDTNQRRDDWSVLTYLQTWRGGCGFAPRNDTQRKYGSRRDNARTQSPPCKDVQCPRHWPPSRRQSQQSMREPK